MKHYLLKVVANIIGFLVSFVNLRLADVGVVVFVGGPFGLGCAR